MVDLIDRLKRRKLVQWALAYSGGAWFVLQLMEIVGGAWNVPSAVIRITQVLIGLGLLATLVIAWYHGERGQQQVSGVELMILAGLLALGGGAVAYLRPDPLESASPTEESGGVPAGTVVRIGVLQAETRAPTDTSISAGLLQYLFATEFSAIPSVAVMDPLSLNTLVGQSSGEDTYRLLRAAGLDFAARISVTSGPEPSGSLLLVRTQSEDVVGRALFSVTPSEDLPEDIRAAVSTLVRSLDENVGLTRAADLRPWLARPTTDVNAVRAFMQGAEYAYLGRPEARAHFERSIQLDPDFIAPRVWLVSVLANLDTAAARSQAELLDAREANATPFEQAMIGWANAVVNDDLASRVDHLRVALTHSPRNNVLLYNLGSALIQLGRYQEAAEPVRLALESGWKYQNLHVLWGIVAIENGQIDGLRTLLENAANSSPQSPYVFGLLEALALYEGDPPAVESHGASFRRRLGTSGTRAAYRELVSVYIPLARLARERGDRDKAELLLQRAADAAPLDPLPHLNLAHLLAESGDLGGAEAHYRMVSKPGGGDSSRLYLQADVAALLGRDDEARAYLTRYLQVAPDGPDAVRARERLRTISSPDEVGPTPGRGSHDTTRHRGPNDRESGTEGAARPRLLRESADGRTHHVAGSP